MKFRIVLLAVVLSSLLGCGYQFQGGGSVLPADIKKVHIPPVQNNTPESKLTAVMTEALQDRFERFGVVYIVESIAEADAQLLAKIERVGRDTRTSTTDTDTDLQLDTIITVSAELRRVTGETLWRNNNVSASKSFGSSREVVVTSSADFSAGSISASDLGQLNDRELSRGQESEIFEDLSEEIARKIYDDAVAPDF